MLCLCFFFGSILFIVGGVATRMQTLASSLNLTELAWQELPFGAASDNSAG